MITRKQSIDQFTHDIDEVINSSYILAEKKIGTLLKTVTCSKLFFELISYCADGFDYQLEINRIKPGEGLPVSNQKKLIALGFSLLTMLDNKEEDLLDVIKKYYPSDSFDRSYKSFAEKFLIPFKEVVISVVGEMVEMAEEKEKNDDKKENSDILSGENGYTGIPEDDFIRSRDIAVSGGGWNIEPSKKYLTCHRDIQKIVISEKGRIIHNKSIKENDKNDLISLLERFRDCLNKGNKEDIKTSFISYKYATQAFKKLYTEVEDIERILKFCHLV